MPKHIKTTKLSQEQLDNLRKEFDSIDVDRSDELSLLEIKSFINHHGLQPQFASLAFKLFDTDGNGRISFDEFTKFALALAKINQDPQLLHKMVFECLDQDHNGYLEPNELLEYINYFSDSPIEDDDIDAILIQLDEDGDGRLTFDEIEKCLQ